MARGVLFLATIVSLRNLYIIKVPLLQDRGQSKFVEIVNLGFGLLLIEYAKRFNMYILTN